MERELVGIIRRASQPLAPEPTGVSPHLPRLGGVRAVIFDVYGTLLVSGSGDISLAQPESRVAAMRTALEACGFTVREGGTLPERFYGVIEQDRAAAMARGVDVPEIEIREICETFLRESTDAGLIGGEIAPGVAARFAVELEVRLNAVWPMPGTREILEVLRERGLALGIASNAQFYTPLSFEALLGQSPAGLGLRPELSVWSYKERISKPSIELYRILAKRLEANGIDRASAVMVGNDVRNDVWPAQDAGLRGVCFAGDARSYRPRREDPRAESQLADATITDLRQLAAIVAG